MSAGDAGAGPQPPVLRVVRGDASAEELAALVVVLSARTAAGTPAVDEVGGPKPRAPGWADLGAVLRRPLRTGRGAWRASGLPH